MTPLSYRRPFKKIPGGIFGRGYLKPGGKFSGGKRPYKLLRASEISREVYHAGKSH